MLTSFSLEGSICSASRSAKLLRCSSSIFLFSKMMITEMEPEKIKSQNMSTEIFSLKCKSGDHIPDHQPQITQQPDQHINIQFHQAGFAVEGEYA